MKSLKSSALYMSVGGMLSFTEIAELVRLLLPM